MFKRGTATTVTRSPNGSSAALDGPTHADTRRRARIAGVFFVVTFISIAALPLYHSVLKVPGFIVGAGGGDAGVQLGAVVEIITAIAGIGTAVALYPILRRRSEGLALGYVTVRVIESSLITVGVVSLLAIVTLRHGHTGGGTDRESLILTGRSLVAVHDATFLLGPAFCAAIGNGLMLGYLMLRYGLLPRRFAQFGMAAGSLALLTALLVLFGVYDQVSGPSAVLTFPEAAWELSLGIYLIAKGFRSDAVVSAGERPTARADERLVGVSPLPHNGAAVARV